MDGSAGVDRGHKAKMEGDADRGSLKDATQEEGGRDKAAKLFVCFHSHIRHIVVVGTIKHQLKYGLKLKFLLKLPAIVRDGFIYCLRRHKSLGLILCLHQQIFTVQLRPGLWFSSWNVDLSLQVKSIL